jgi:hypothetical protein
MNHEQDNLNNNRLGIEVTHEITRSALYNNGSCFWAAASAAKDSVNLYWDGCNRLNANPLGLCFVGATIGGFGGALWALFPDYFQIAGPIILATGLSIPATIGACDAIGKCRRSEEVRPLLPRP